MSWAFERVVLARHGETEWNRLGRRQGQLDSPLTIAGRRHAEVVARLVASAGIDSIFSSPLGRAQLTAVIIAETIGSRVQVVDGLAEVHHGAFAGLTNEEIEATYPGEMARRGAAKYTWRFPGGESYADASVRASAALDEVARSGSSSPLLVAHEMIGRLLVRALLGLTPDEALSLSLPHGTALEVSPTRGTVKAIN